MIARIVYAAALAAVAATSAVGGPTIFLARHAEKADGAADPKNPELSATGRARAERLAQIVRDADVVAIFATEFTRTQQTAEAIARTTRAEVKMIGAKETRALIDTLAALDGNAVVIGHSNTLPEIIKALGLEKPITIADDEYDNLFVWHRSSPGELIRLRY